MPAQKREARLEQSARRVLGKSAKRVLGLDLTGIHVLFSRNCGSNDVDGRNSSGHDEQMVTP
jgi:hypothetical protein